MNDTMLISWVVHALWSSRYGDNLGWVQAVFGRHYFGLLVYSVLLRMAHTMHRMAIYSVAEDNL